ncbi:predicted protein [Sclerotinia sclerotiorum 1980 UF-70]|uniref:Uncharacterized protein n=1 Tax=Sclerotinia sclerotiorum (strain ATCC 18683 / 1980 / Ss-1) TaxID=665079 RepID=A7EGN2_SCLS1|nr:predicted protein [Sclerotinia sclerotiorum 1980 UF-70]EDO01998.1 predicted protein [Sclerotinia sclerotiorum 1980 UF-70]
MAYVVLGADTLRIMNGVVIDIRTESSSKYQVKQGKRLAFTSQKRENPPGEVIRLQSMDLIFSTFPCTLIIPEALAPITTLR